MNLRHYWDSFCYVFHNFNYWSWLATVIAKAASEEINPSCAKTDHVKHPFIYWYLTTGMWSSLWLHCVLNDEHICNEFPFWLKKKCSPQYLFFIYNICIMSWKMLWKNFYLSLAMITISRYMRWNMHDCKFSAIVLVCMHFLFSIDQTYALSVVTEAIYSPLASQQK